ncbi:MAG: 1-deoxy-D-xylulose-5-phosphate synthase, partial [Mycobacterium sp.]|nr:1-deoxy-D-xylulose-5-phosphate synthase [Mycobacterium sp.]
MLEQVRGPADLQRLTQDQLTELAAEIRQFLIHKVAATGGHLGPNLGVVEVTLALHRVFDSPHDPIIFDTGHQAYVHKMLTGRWADFDTLRCKGGLSGYPSRSESDHDWVESSHASSALSYADGLAKAFELTGQRNRHVVAVVGDGALTGGMCWEALNNIAAARRPVVIVVNDNGRSYAPTIGGLADHLAGLRLQPIYERILERGRSAVRGMPVVGEVAYQAMHSVKVGLKDAISPQAMFTDLGLKYVGPIDGHDEHAVENALRHARGFNAPVIVHVVTRKGMGYAPAENDEAEQMHACGIIDPETGLATTASAPGWTSVFSDSLIAYAAKRRDIVAITAAMPGPTGLAAFGERYPDRLFDVGIAEQHAMTSAAGLAMGGLHPVVAIYSTFLNRAFDQLLMDVALHKMPVTIVLDRAGITGNDGASHNGMWDLSVLNIIPGIQVAAPRDGARLREELGEALD